MNSTKLEKGIRGAVVGLVVVAGLLASTPNVHGTADTRGGAPCDVNKSFGDRCTDAGYTNVCLYTHTVCYSVAGWRFMTCTLKPLSSNGCERDKIRCLPADDYMPNGNCSPSYQAASGAALTPASSARASQVQ